VHTYTRRYNWADVTQEIYGVGRCDEFTDGPFLFANMSMRYGDGGAVRHRPPTHPAPLTLFHTNS
jgi:hypothetical protein